MVSTGFAKQVTFEQRREECEGIGHMDTWGKKKRQCKRPESWVRRAYLRNGEGVSAAASVIGGEGAVR